MSMVCYDYIRQDNNLYSKEFINGIHCLKARSLGEAWRLFELAFEAVDIGHINHRKYASFCGFLRVLHGDHGGLTLCRNAARFEINDGDIFLNLARVELFYDSRKRAIDAILKGLEIDPKHAGLRQMHHDIGMRERKALPLLGRNNLLNKLAGKLKRRKEPAWQGDYPFRF